MERELTVAILALCLAIAPAAGALSDDASTLDQTLGSEDPGDERTFAIEQPTVPPLVAEVEPLSNGERIEEFYRTPPGNSVTGLERADTSIIFLWEGPEGTSLVVVHDKPGSDGGGAATLNFTGVPAFGTADVGPVPGLPGEGSWVIQESPGDFGPPSQPPNVISWSWLDGENDGGAYRGGMDAAFTVIVEPAFNDDALEPPRDPGTVDAWVFLSGDVDDPTTIELDMETPLVIEGTP